MTTDVAPALLVARRAFAARAWQQAFEAFAEIDRKDPLAPAGLELLARSAYMIGRDDDYVAALDRAHQLYVDHGDVPAAVRCTCWIGHNLMFRGQAARAGGWFEVGRHLLEDAAIDCVERGYLLIPTWLQEMGRGDWEAGLATATEAAAIGDQFGDEDLSWLARDDQGKALVKLGRVEEGLRLVNEVLVVVSSGRTVAGGQRDRLLQHDRLLPRGVRAASRSRVDGRAHPVVRRATADGGAQRAVPGAPGRGDAADRRLAQRAEGGRARRGAVHARCAQPDRVRQGVLPPRERSIGCRAGSPPPSRPTARRTAVASSRSPVSRCSGWPRATRHRLLRPSGGRSPSTPQPLQRAALLPAYVEIMLADGDLDCGPSRVCSSSTRSASDTRPTRSTR